MSAGKSASFIVMIHFLLCLSEAPENITAELRQEVILPCKVSNNKPITVVKWSRPELDPDYVLFYRGRKLMSDNQHPSYVNRVDLQDREMKNGDVSLILKDVKMNDTGTYKCRVFQRETNHRKRFSLETKIINLVVGPSGDKDGGDKDGGDKDGGHKGGGDKVEIILVVVGVILLLLVAPVGFWIYKRCMGQNSKPPVPHDEPTGEKML